MLPQVKSDERHLDLARRQSPLLTRYSRTNAELVEARFYVPQSPFIAVPHMRSLKQASPMHSRRETDSLVITEPRRMMIR